MVCRMFHSIRRFVSNQSGTMSVEYILIAAGIFLAILILVVEVHGGFRSTP